MSDEGPPTESGAVADGTRSSESAGASERQDKSAAERRSRRLPMPGVLVAIDAAEIAPQPWVVDSIDINAHGIGLVLPPEIPEGTRVRLSFRLDSDHELSQVSAVVRHKDGASGGVLFGSMPDADRLTLLEFLVDAYERD